MNRRNIGLIGAVVLAGCTLAEVKVDVVSERTALENQVLGTYNALDTEMLLVASVRGVDPAGQIREEPRHSQEHRDAVLALQVLAFHEDDVTAFKRLGWVGENTEGLLTALALDRSAPPEDLAEFAAGYGKEEFQAVVEQVNGARETTMRRVIAVNPALTEVQYPEVRRVFARLNAESSPSGTRIQAVDGSWAVKE